MARRVGTLLAAAATVVVALAGCSSSPSSAPTSSAGDATITVFAAASLTAAFTDLAQQFEHAHPGVTVQLSFAGSSDLVTQITEGAPADVFASADETNMAKLTDARLVGDPIDFATNVLEIAVPTGNPADVATLADLADPAVRTVICAPEVPCGAAAIAVEKAAGITIPAVSEESSVTDVLGKVSSGEADAGLVYVTDIARAGDAVRGIPFDESAQAVNTYPIAVTDASGSPDLAQQFVDLVTGAEGRTVLAAAGFGAP